MSASKPKITLWYCLLALLLGLGVIALAIRITQGLASTYLTSAMPWGTWVAFYIYFVGMSAGAFLLSSLIHVFGMQNLEKVGRDATVVAIISIILAMVFILMDLGHMERFWHALWYWNITSVLGWEIRFYAIYLLLLLAELYYALRQDLVLASGSDGLKAKLAGILKLGSNDTTAAGLEKDRRRLKMLGAIGIPIAIFGVHGGTGLLFAVVKAQPYWNMAIFPVVFVISALVSGTALVTVLYILRTRAAGKEAELPLIKSLSGWMVLFLLIDVGLQFFEVLVGAYGLEEQELATLATIFTSDFSWSYWGVQLGLGVVAPLVLFFHPRTRESVNALLLAAAMVVVGILGVRFNIVVPALTVPVLAGLPAGYYYPTWVEWALSGGIIGFGLLLYTLAVRYLPMDIPETKESGEV